MDLIRETKYIMDKYKITASKSLGQNFLIDSDVVYGIVELILKGVINRIKERGIDLSFTKTSIKWLVEEGYDMEFGARPLKRIVQAQVETLLARKIIAGEIREGDKIEVFYDKRIPGLNIRPKVEKEAIPQEGTQNNSASANSEEKESNEEKQTKRK